jgi:saccharopine dehydrogenase-like NADP-dependent oxidoreductase
MSRIVVLGGAGIIGQAIAQDLAEDVDEVVVADLNEAGARQVAGRLGRGCTPQKVDVTDPASLDSILKGADACINSAQYYYNLDGMQGCLRSRVPYIDLGGLFHKTREQLLLDGACRSAGITAVLGLGSCPGISNVQAGYLASFLDTVESVKIYNGSTQEQGESLSWSYSIETILDEISQPAIVFRDGDFQEFAPLGEEEAFYFPEPIGYARTHLSLHSEVATLPLSLAGKGIRECFFKISFFGYPEAALRKMQFLVELGFARKEPVNVNGTRVAPRDVLIALLRESPAAGRPYVHTGYKDIATVVKGRQDGREVVLRMDTGAWPNSQRGISGGKLMVAGPPAIVARWLAGGSLHRPGVWPPEQVVDGEALFRELSHRGAETHLTRTWPL